MFKPLPEPAETKTLPPAPPPPAPSDPPLVLNAVYPSALIRPAPDSEPARIRTTPPPDAPLREIGPAAPLTVPTPAGGRVVAFAVGGQVVMASATALLLEEPAPPPPPSTRRAALLICALPPSPPPGWPPLTPTGSFRGAVVPLAFQVLPPCPPAPALLPPAPATVVLVAARWRRAIVGAPPGVANRRAATRTQAVTLPQERGVVHRRGGALEHSGRRALNTFTFLATVHRAWNKSAVGRGWRASGQIAGPVQSGGTAKSCSGNRDGAAQGQAARHVHRDDAARADTSTGVDARSGPQKPCRKQWPRRTGAPRPLASCAHWTCSSTGCKSGSTRGSASGSRR